MKKTKYKLKEPIQLQIKNKTFSKKYQQNNRFINEDYERISRQHEFISKLDKYAIL